ncbi:hypothetical protein DPMN_119565 [Dreissena polymorpha]|uniref:Uncharacterized protein n=1 Tax=Dreissena polymorpha TaxID=45954 RepID=A0A9D4GMM3_DREPO|nr:hypothetical protein DPMN_119565 [Dreissena polymorpha]
MQAQQHPTSGKSTLCQGMGTAFRLALQATQLSIKVIQQSFQETPLSLQATQLLASQLFC